ncbi:MAG: fibrillarin-like rRNA/tRNA 2'-O-methyltransferase [Methanobrevibacter sp.]|jgi:fibrillarin-like pre-rRNA processing protein|nr:fibrillarin-like rRNA/tRNA 2'-O-methyltransferase [Methanobrevibacter sp.]
MNIYSDSQQIATENLIVGKKVYGEKLIIVNKGFKNKNIADKDFKNEKVEDLEKKIEYRVWNPKRSKLAAALLNGLKSVEINENSKILYLGASTGTTVSHISDIAKNGLIYAVEFSPTVMRKLVRLSNIRKNIAPILGDATKPKRYLNLLEDVDLVYCDVAQPNQAKLFIDNVNLFLKENSKAILMLKAKSIDVSLKLQKIFKEAEQELKSKGFRVIEKVKLEPYEKDHLCFVVEKNF